LGPQAERAGRAGLQGRQSVDRARRLVAADGQGRRPRADPHEAIAGRQRRRQPRRQLRSKGALMFVRVLIAIGTLLTVTASPAQQTVTVKSLLAQDFVVVGSVPSTLGAGLFLQRKDKVFLCFVSETTKSPTVTTKYCKPVE